MENNNQYTNEVDGSDGGIHNPQSLDIGALAMPESLSDAIDRPAVPSTLRGSAFKSRFGRTSWISFSIMGALVLGITAAVIVRLAYNRNTVTTTSVNSVASKYATQQVPLASTSLLQSGASGISLASTNVVINGKITLNKGVVIAPSVQPNTPTAGQLYFDQNTNQLAYYNGASYVALKAQSQTVESIGGLGGQVTLGGGLSVVGNQLTATNSGVLAVGGQTGQIAVGNGLRMNGNILQNAGITSVSAGTPNLIVTDDGNGNVVISNVGGGSGTVTSGGGSAGVLPLFTATQNIENSLVSQSGGTVTVGGNLAVSGTLTVGSPISVGSGGTGTNTLTANGLVIGNGSGALTTITSGGAGLCLLSTVAAPAFGACPSGSGVSSLNGLAGGLTIANATGAVNTITIDDATTGAKGIASFNATNFTVTAGAVNTVQNIGAGASPTFAGLNTNTITPGGTLTVTGATANLLVQGGTGTFGTLSQAGSLVLSDGSSNTATITLTGHAANRNYTIPDTGADANFCLSTGNCVGSGGGAPNDATYLVATLNGTLTNERALTAGTNVSVTDGGANGNMTVATVNNPSFSASVTTPVLQSSGALTISSAAGTTVALDAGTTIELQDSTNVTGNLDISGSFTSGAANAFQISAGGAITAATGIVSSGTITFSGLNCTGNANGGALTTNGSGQLVCSDDDGGSGSAITGSGSSGTVPLFNGTQTITNSIITQSGTTINIAGDLTLSTQLSVANGGTGATSLLSNGVIYGNGTGALQATAAGTGGQVLVANASGVPTFMSISGDVTVSNTGVAAIQANSVALGTDTTGNYVANLGSLTGLSTSGNSGEGSTPTLSVLYGASAGNAVEGNTSLTCTSGTGNLSGGGGSITLGTGGSCGTISTVNNPTFSTSVTTPSLIITGAGSNGTLQVANLGQATTYTLPDPGAGTATICLSTGNCAGSGGGVTTTGGTTNRLSKFTGSQSLGDSSLSDNGTVVTVNGAANLAVQGGTSTLGTLSQAGMLAISDGSSNTVSIVASGLAADRTYTLPDVGGPATFCLDTGNCVGGGGGGAPNSAAYLVATLDGTLTNERALAAGSNISVTDGGANGNMTVATVNNPSFSASVTTPILQSSGALTISSGATTVAIDATTTIELQDSTNVTGNIDISGTFTSGTANAFTISSGGTITAATGITSSGTITFSGLNCTGNINGGALTTNGSGQLVCSDDDGGSGSAITGSGTSGTIPLFNGTQTLTNSIITQSGTTISIAGDLTLTTALSVANGGTGANSFLTNGILYGNNTGAVQVTAAGTSGQVLVADGSGVPTFVSFSGDVAVSSTGATTIQANSVALGTDTTGNYVGTLGSLTGLTTSGNTGEGSTPTLSVTYGSGANTAVQGNTSLSCPSGSGNLSGGGTAITLGTGGSCAAIDTVANPNFTTSVTTPLLQSAGAMSITPGGALTIGATGQSFTMQGNGSSVITATNSGFATTVGFTGTATGAVRYNFNQAAAAGTYDICTTAGNCAGGGASFIQGGNSFGTTGVLGTNDTQNLQFETNNIVRATFDQSNGLYLGNGITAAAPNNFTLAGTGSSTAGTAGANLTLQGGAGASTSTGSVGGTLKLIGGDAGGSGNNAGGVVTLQGGAATGSGVTGYIQVKNAANSTTAFQVLNNSNNPVLKVNTTGDVVDITGQLGIAGTLHITGTTTENYLTPNGASVNARINVANSDPGAFGQIMAMGVTTTANINARVLSLFDGRTVSHQPTLAVLSPNENNIIGLSWNGSNSIGYLMSSDNGGGGSTASIGVHSGVTSGGGDSGTLTLQSGDIAGGTGNTSGAVFLISGNGAGTNASSGAVTIDSGAQTGSGTTGAINIGISNATTLTLGRAAGTTVLNGTVQVSSLASAAATSEAVCRENATGKLTLCDAVSGARPFIQGGNSFGSLATLGTNDTANLALETNNVTRALFDQSNNLYLGLGATAAAPTAFTVQSTGSSTAGTAGAALSIQGGAGMTTSTGSAGGNLTLAGGASVGGSGNNAGGIVTLQGGAATNTGTAGYVLVKNTQNSATAFEVQDTASAPLINVDTTARSASGGNLVKIGDSTGTDGATTILKLDSAASAPTTNLAALNGGLLYVNNKITAIENGVVKTLCNTTDLGCGTSTVRLDQIQAATSGATINNANNNIVWNWAMTGTGAGMALGENTAATGGGTQNQSILQIATLSGSTASPLKVTSNSADGGDIVFNLNGNGDIEFQDAGTAFMTLSDTGAVNITLDATDSPVFKVDNLGSGEVGFYQTNGAFRIYDNSTVSFAVDSSGNVQVGKSAAGTYVTVGDATGQPTPDLFVLDNKGTAGDPSTIYTGAMYYNGISNKFRCNQNSAWVDCIQAAGANTSLSNLSSVAINAALGFQSTSAAAINFAAAATTNGNAMNFTGQSAGTTGTGGSFTFTPGAGGSTASGTPGAAGGFTINSATGEAGTGSAVQAGTGSAFSFQGGTGGANASAGGIGGNGGGYSITAGNGGAAASGTAGSGGAILIRAGDASGSGSAGNGGTITLDPGLGNGGTDGVVQIGNAVADGTGQILVLDNSTSTSDPTGVDGAMYYNASMGVMRCYIDGSWQHCNDPTRLASGYNIQEEFIGEALGSNEGQGWTCGTGTVGMGTTHSWNCNGTGSDSTVAAVAADSYQRPGQLQLTTGTGSTNSIITFLGGSNGKPFVIGGGESFETAINIPTLSNGTQRYVARFGLCDATESHNVDCTNGVYFEYDSNTSANWRYATAAASSRTKASSTKAVAAGWTNLKWEATANNNINFYVKSAGDTNYTFLGSSSATIPSSTANATRIMFELDKFAGTTARTFTIDYMDYWNDFTTKR